MKIGLLAALAAAGHLRLQREPEDTDPPSGEVLEGPPPAVEDGALPPAADGELPEDTSDATEAKLKWIKKAGKVNKALFSIACRFKHKTDIRGLAESRMRAEGWEAEEFQDFISDVQKENVETMKESCGLISADSWKRCREGCSNRWHAKEGTNKFTAEKETCIGLCEKKHKDWKVDCEGQSENLKNLYTVHQTDALKGSSCQNLHCRRFPDILTGETKEDMEKTRDENCGKECTPERITRKCKQKYLMEKDFKLMDFEDECHQEKKVDLETCQKELEGKVSTDHTQCESDLKATCGSQYDECVGKGDQGREAFCSSRQNLCEEQVTAECLGKHKKALEEGADTCVDTFDTDKKACVKERITKDETESLKKCEENDGPECDTTCKEKCNVDDLQSCLGELASTAGATDAFCNNLWDWLYASEEVNPKTGDPAPLL